MSQEKPPKKLSRSVRYNKKRRLNTEQKSTLPAERNEHTPTITISINDIPPEIKLDTPCIIFNPNRVYTFLISVFNAGLSSCRLFLCLCSANDRSTIFKLHCMGIPSMLCV